MLKAYKHNHKMRNKTREGERERETMKRRLYKNRVLCAFWLRKYVAIGEKRYRRAFFQLNNINPFWIEQRIYYKTKTKKRHQAMCQQTLTHTNHHTHSVAWFIIWMILRGSFVSCAVFWLRSPWSWKWYTYSNHEISFLFSFLVVIAKILDVVAVLFFRAWTSF